MNLSLCEVQNFGSYEKLRFDFQNTGLSLVYGPTGSGKSTLMDIPMWILFGVTSKNGSADEVRSWTSKDKTIGILTVDLQSCSITVTRIRGASQQNDLYWTENSSEEKVRGKDLKDTQKLLNEKLGIDADLYSVISGFNEFNETAAFFTAKAKDKRSVFDKITNLSLPITLSERVTTERRAVKKEIELAELASSRLSGQYDKVLDHAQELVRKQETWAVAHTKHINMLLSKATNFTKENTKQLTDLKAASYAFEQTKAHDIAELIDKIDELDLKIVPIDTFEVKLMALELEPAKRCTKCGNVNGQHELISQIKDERRKNEQLIERRTQYTRQIRDKQQSANIYDPQIEMLSKQVNHYKKQAMEEQLAVNPFTQAVEEAAKQLDIIKESREASVEHLAGLKHGLLSLEQLYDISLRLRGLLVQNAVKSIETKVNSYIEEFFDAEIRVQFALEDSDNLTVYIQKNGHDCVFTQLSKGQRQLLKLCFSTSVMLYAANQAGIHVSTLMFDEALDGLDTNLKLKAFAFFETLSTDHASILLIDHAPEFQSMFDNKYAVSLSGDNSEITKE